jgi:hypothetical protein
MYSLRPIVVHDLHNDDFDADGLPVAAVLAVESDEA